MCCLGYRVAKETVVEQSINLKRSFKHRGHILYRHLAHYHYLYSKEKPLRLFVRNIHSILFKKENYFTSKPSYDLNCFGMLCMLSIPLNTC